jgi:hypothetical protein
MKFRILTLIITGLHADGVENRQSECRHLQNRGEDQAMQGYSMIVRALTNTFEMVKSLVGPDRHREMFQAEINQMINKKNKMQDYLNTL